MAKIIIERNKSFFESAYKFDVYLANTYIGKLERGGQLEINVDVGSHRLFFKSRFKVVKSLDTLFEVTVNKPNEIVEIKSRYDIWNGNFMVEYADNTPMYVNLTDTESDTTRQNQLYCSKCGTKLIEGAKFCNNCGQVINQPYYKPKTSVQFPKLKYRNLMTCRSCGALVAKTAKTCPKCGAKTPGQILGEAGSRYWLRSASRSIFYVVNYILFYFY